MELCFIWVADFRNIRDQGFNLSSKFQMSFNQRRDYLQIDQREQYIPEFFGLDVTNVTGIVGENAAGKTNLLELINYMMDGGNTRIAAPFFMVFEEFRNFTVYSYQLPIIESNKTITFENYSGSKLPLEAIFFTNIFDGRRHEFGKKIHDLSTNRILQNQFGENVQTNLKKEVQAQIRFLQSNVYRDIDRLEREAYPNGRLDIKPAHVQFISPAWENINSRARNFDRVVSSLLGDNFANLAEFCQSYRKKITGNMAEKSFIYFTAFLLFLDFLSNEFMPEAQSIRRVPSSLSPDRLREGLEVFQLEELKLARINEIHDAITGRIASFIDDNYPHTFEKTKFLYEIDSFYFPSFEKLSEGTYTSRKFQFRAELTPDVERFIYKYTEATTQLNLNYSIEWLGISSGQKAFLNIFSRLYSVSGNLEKDSVLVTIDEGDLYFHPRWQVEYLSRLLRVLPLIFRDKKIQLVLTTHSPFLVSDLTKNHLIFLRKDELQRCEVIPPEQLTKETFGGNIGELYLNAFFLNGNLISHFAAEKIRQLADRVKNDLSNYSHNDELLIEQLGDKLIQFQLKKFLNDPDR